MNNKAKKIICVAALFFLFLGPVCRSASAASPGDISWQELKSEHFIIYFASGQNFAKEVLNKAESYYRQIASDLGYSRYSSFWTWDNRVKIYIYPDQKSFLKASNQPNWSQGMADYTNKSIISYQFSNDFTDGLLPHEMTHLTFRDFVGFKGEVPLWLDEGIAQWEESLKREHLKEMAFALYQRGALIPLRVMMTLDIRKSKPDDKIIISQSQESGGKTGNIVLKGDDLVNTFYLQSVTLVGFLIETYGSYRFADFCRQLRDGNSMDDALKSAYDVRVQNLEELETNWRSYLRDLHSQ